MSGAAAARLIGHAARRRGARRAQGAVRSSPVPLRWRRHLSIVICGHVDSGKSTTTGRLLFELGGIPERELEKLKVRLQGGQRRSGTASSQNEADASSRHPRLPTPIPARPWNGRVSGRARRIWGGQGAWG